MAILNSLFDKKESDDLAWSIGNVILSGAENEGGQKLYFNTLREFLLQKKTVILLDGLISREKHLILTKYTSGLVGEGNITDLGYFDASDSVDILSAFEKIDDKANFVADMISDVLEMSETVKKRVYRYFLYAMEALELLGKEYFLRDVLQLDVDAVIDLVHALPLSDADKKRRLLFLEDKGTYLLYLDIGTGVEVIERSGLIPIFSGDTKLSKLLGAGCAVMLKGLVEDAPGEKKLLFDLFLKALEKYMESARKSDVVFIIRNADFISHHYMINAFEYHSSYRCATYYFVEDITRYVQKNGNQLLDKANGFLVFQQGSDENASFWSAFFGGREMQESTYSYMKKKSWNPFSVMSNEGGVVSGSQSYDETTKNVQIVYKPLYRPEVFKELKPTEVMCYLCKPLIRKKARIEV